jgi:hypothetical protein
MKVGFTLKSKKKPSNVVGKSAATTSVGGFRVEKEKEEDMSRKDLVVGFGSSGKAVLKDPAPSQSQLVIPLIQQNWNNKSKPTSSSAEDQAAAEALLADIRTTGDNHHAATRESTLVIPAVGVPSTTATTTTAPLLSRNKIPGMDTIVGETDKFRHDLSMRPDEVDINSDAYEAVPIEEFGAALLRGMGWSGKERVKPTGAKVSMRHQRLGLGATPKPTLEGTTDEKLKRKQLGRQLPMQKDTTKNNHTERSGAHTDKDTTTRYHGNHHHHIERKRYGDDEHERRSKKKRSRSRSRDSYHRK